MMTSEQAMQEATAAYQCGDLGRAEQICSLVLAADRDCFDALNLLGIIAVRTSRRNDAQELFRRAVAVEPHNAAAHNNYGNALKDGRRFQEALHCYEHALCLAPDFIEAHLNRGVVLQRLNRLDEALENYDAALRLKPDFAPALNHRSAVLLALNRPLEALASSDSALRLGPPSAFAHKNHGDALYDLRQLDAALASYGKALQANPHYAEVWYNRANVLLESNHPAEALESYDRALALNPDYARSPDYAHTHFNRGNIQVALGRPEEALRSFETGLSILPECDWLFGTWLRTKMMLCDWGGLDSHRASLCAAIAKGARIASPFTVLTLIDSPPLQRQAAQIRVLALFDCLSLQRQGAETLLSEKYPASRVLPAIIKRGRQDKVRVGYFSGDYRNHPVSLLTAEMFERHDRSRFEVNAFSFGPDTQDETRKRMERAFNRFIDVRGKSDLDIVRLARSMELDIAADLGGFTEGSRPNLFALRAAPLQVSYLGYLGTLGAAYMDYLIANTTIIPLQHQRHYAEKIVYLPSYQVNDSKRVISDKRFSREELGLPRTGFVFCCFNASYKIVPETFDCWMRILSQVDDSVLFLLADNATTQRNLRNEAVERGVAADRLVFGKRLPGPEYLARYRSADLFLDTLPYNAGTTASDALWAGLPVLTHMGESFAARVAASLLNAIGLPELVTTTQEQYEATAIELASNPARLAEFKDRLHGNRLTMPLFDTEQFTRHLENAYTQMYERYQADLTPEHIHA
jgi:predicted O-linked N-acetylglucosamine transferase (SPINDLY family)